MNVNDILECHERRSSQEKQNWTLPSNLIPQESPNQATLHHQHSFHLSQPLSRSYRSILPTSLIYVMLFRHQRLLTLRTWCGYRYEMVWKWFTTTHYFSWSNMNTQLLRQRLLHPKNVATLETQPSPSRRSKKFLKTSY